MTLGQRSRYVLAIILLIAGLVPFVVFLYFGAQLALLETARLEQGHEMVVWLSLVYSFCAFILAALLAYTVKRVITKKSLTLLLLPFIVSGVFVAGIPLMQVIVSLVSKNA